MLGFQVQSLETPNQKSSFIKSLEDAFRKTSEPHRLIFGSSNAPFGSSVPEDKHSKQNFSIFNLNKLPDIISEISEKRANEIIRGAAALRQDLGGQINEEQSIILYLLLGSIDTKNLPTNIKKQDFIKDFKLELGFLLIYVIGYTKNINYKNDASEFINTSDEARRYEILNKYLSTSSKDLMPMLANIAYAIYTLSKIGESGLTVQLPIDLWLKNLEQIAKIIEDIKRQKEKDLKYAKILDSTPTKTS
ncbi:MAG: hypothetical protein N3E51_00755 [Candidatus Micrarchaeota archaeon]|nr:hypothetical protein [Candidatus Micrarchaeota archaeon]